jgi:YidC/Oxa1 family membrane protein insertase
MENKRFVIIVALLIVSYMMVQNWVIDYGSPFETEQPVAQNENNAISSDPSKKVIVIPDEGVNDLPAVETQVIPQDVPSNQPLVETKQAITVKTDVLDVVIDTQGGDVRVVSLPTYPVSIEEGAKSFRLLNDRLPDFFIAQNGILTASSGSKAPTHKAIFSAEKTSYELSPGEDLLKVNLYWSDSGLSVTKTYTFSRGSFAIEVSNTLQNKTGKNWSGKTYQQLQRTFPSDDNSSAFIYTYTGGVIYTDSERFEKVDFEDMFESNLSRDTKGGWVAMIQHYFLGAWVPAAGESNHIYSKALKRGIEPKYILGVTGASFEVADQAQVTLSNVLYTGPKLQHTLSELSEGLDLTVDYGVLTILAKPLYWVLEFFYGIFSNWGWAIIFVTISIKAVFYKLSETGYKSMANMRKVTPRIKSIKEKYGSDRAKMNQEMMKLYKTEKINPLGGCLPILVQIPVFIALYWVLLESVELRQAPFILWIEDLSIADPYFVLPLLMGISMYIQQKLNPPPVDPIQAKVMMMLPFVFTVFFALFPAGLVLYWVANNTLSIIQQWIITKRITEA